MGIVYLAHDSLYKQEVALKRLNVPSDYLQFTSKTSGSPAGNILMTLAHEFQILSSLRHPNIVDVLDYGFDSEQKPYFTMELLSNSSQLLVSSIEYTLEQSIEHIIDILQALAYLHRRGVVHRDLKPENVLIHNDRVVVLDFGLAVSTKYSINTLDSSSGTVTHMAPEVLMGEEATSRSDLYAVGCIAYEMLTGRHPFNVYELDLASFVGLVTSSTPDTSLLPLPVSKVILRLMALDPNNRYESASEAIKELCEATGIALPSETIDIRNSYLQAAEFTGRQAEFETLTQAVDSTTKSNGCSWLITGVAGVGKTRLISELRTYCLVQGMHVLIGQVDRVDASPYQPWRNILRWLAMATSPNDSQVSTLSSIFNDIADFLDRSTNFHASALDADKERQRLYYTIQALLDQIIDPVLIIIEDLQWADSYTLDLMNWLSRFINEKPIMLVGSYRNEEALYLSDHLSNWSKLTLSRLNEDDIKQLSRSMLGEVGASSAVVELINRETEGNAYFMVEVVRTLAEEFGRLENINAQDLPTTIVAQGMLAVLERRINQISEPDRQLVQLAAVGGRYINKQLLVALNNGQSIDNWLLNCSETAVIDFDSKRWRFTHDKLRDAILDRIDQPTLRTMHRHVAITIEQSFDNLDEYVSQLAYHWQNAGDRDNERKYQIIKGTIAQRQFANTEAIQSFQRALELGGNRLELSYSISKIYRTISQWDKAIDTLQDALSNLHNKSHSDKIQIARCQALLGDMLASYRAEHELGLDLLESSKSVFEDTDDFSGIIEVFSSLSSIYISRGNLSQSVDFLTQLTNLALKIEDFTGLSDGYRKMGRIYYQQGDFDKALEYYNHALNIAEEIDNTELISRTYFSLGVLYYNLNDLPKALDNYKKLYQLTKKIGDVSQESETILSIGSLYERDGDFASAKRCCEYGLSMSSQLDDQLGSSIGLIYLALSLSGENKFNGAIDCANLAIAIVRKLDKKYHLAGYLTIQAKIYLSGKNFKSTLETAEEANAIAISLGAKQYIIESTLLVNYSRFLLKMQTQEDSKSNVESIIDDSLADQFKAQIYFILWKINPDHETARQHALDLYRDLIDTSPIYEYRNQYSELTGHSTTSRFHLPDIHSIIPDIDSVDNIYLSRIQKWLDDS